MKTLIIEDKEFKYKWWENEIMSGKIISFDLETELIQSSLHIPKVSLAMAWDGIQLFLVHPEKLAEFFFKNRNQSFVGHNIQFDFWAAHELMKNKNQIASCRILWDSLAASRLHDTLVLDMLIQLGNGRYRNATGYSKTDEKVYPTNLAVLAKEAGTINLDKEDPYRMRFGELLGMSEAEIDAHPESLGFISYALPDVIATYDVYFDVYNKAVKLMNSAGFKDNKSIKKYEISPDSLKKYGPLSEAIQVRGSIVLAQLSRTPLDIDLVKRQKFEDEERKLLSEAYEVIEAYNPLLIKRWSKKSKKHEPNSPQISPKTGLKCLSNIQLKLTLMEECQRLDITKIPVSVGKKKEMSVSAKDWTIYTDKSEFIKKWCEIVKHSKMLQFLAAINHPQVYTNYNLLMKTGRTSASKHSTRKGQDQIPSVNIQQIPREGKMRELFIAPKNKFWHICDYSFIELRTLAATCKAVFGFSNLGNVIVDHYKNGGLDPHEIMAVGLMKTTKEHYMQLDKKVKKENRQMGKACFHPDVECLTKQGWKKVSELTMSDYVIQFHPETEELEWTLPLALTMRENKKLIRVYNKCIDIRVTEDHRMLGYRTNGTPKIVFPKQMNTLVGIWNAGKLLEGVNIKGLSEVDIRQAVAIQADSSIKYHKQDYASFGFKKQRKIDRFKWLFNKPEETKVDKNGMTWFYVPFTDKHKIILDDKKLFKLDVLMSLSYEMREIFLDEIKYWDSHISKEGLVSYGTIEKNNIDTIQAIASLNNKKTKLRVKYLAHGNWSTYYEISIKKHNYTWGNTFNFEELTGEYDVFCLSVPSSYVLVRDGGKPIITANCSFGLPGGLGVKKFVSYAETQYGVKFTETEAKEAKQTWMNIYPEMKLHLQDVSDLAVAYNLKCKVSEVRKLFPKDSQWSDKLRGVKDGLYNDKNEGELNEKQIESLNKLLTKYRPDLIELLKEKSTWRDLHDELFLYRASTLTGRVKGKAGYCDGKNASFQGLASDGGKESLFQLMYKGYIPKAFIHDEIICEVNPKTAKDDAKRIESIMCKTMESVIGHGIPVACEGHLSSYWVK